MELHNELQPIEAYLEIIYRVISKNYSTASNNFLDKDDLYQYGFIGLHTAYSIYDPDRGIPFNNFAWQHIRWEISKAISQYEITGYHASLEMLRRYKQASKEIEEGDNLEEKCRQFNITVNSYNKLKSQSYSKTQSLDRYYTSEGEDFSLQGYIVDDTVDVERCVVDKIYYTETVETLNNLPTTTRRNSNLKDIIHLTLKGLNPSEIAEELNCSRQSIYQYFQRLRENRGFMEKVSY